MIQAQTKLMDEAQPYLLNLHTRQIHDSRMATGQCRLATLQPERVVTSDSVRQLRNWNINSPQNRGKLNKICSHCIGG
jgi:hypothetical protein